MNSQNEKERCSEMPVYVPFTPKNNARLEKRNEGPLTFQKTSIPPSTNQSIHESLSPSKNLNKRSAINNSNAVGSLCGQPLRANEVQDQYNILNIQEELLLSSQSISSKKNVGQGLVCPIHFKNQEIICMIDKVKICAHCALFGNHKDHSFKAENQIIEEIMQRKKEIGDVDHQRQKLIDPAEIDNQWCKLKSQCKNKQKQLLKEVQDEYQILLKKIQGFKKQAQQKIIEKSNILQQQLIQQECFYKRQIKSNSILEQWISKWRKILQELTNSLDQSAAFTICFNEYQMFAWNQGATIVSDYKTILSRSKEKISRSISEMSTFPSLSSLLGTLRHDHFSSSNIQFPSQINTSFTSIDDFHWANHRVKTDCSELCQYDNEFLQIKEFGSSRKSELLQTIKEANRNSVKFMDKNQRMSAKCFSKKNNCSSSKKQNKYMGPASNSTFLSGKKSQSNLQTSILPPKPRLTSPRSYNTSRQKSDPMIKLRQYELNQSCRFLDLSDCGLSQDSLVYFLEKAQRIRHPQEVKLERNHISACGFSKLIPYLSSCKRINLSYCGVGQSCLDSILRCKQLKALTECILIGNQINQRKSRVKIEELNKAGVKIVLL